jgi:hypothetical protein
MPSETNNNHKNAGRGLSPRAYVELEPGEKYQPYIAAAESIPEFTFKDRRSVSSAAGGWPHRQHS